LSNSRTKTVDPLLIGEPPWFASLLTSPFLHLNAAHLLGNMYLLWILGDDVEDVLGRF
nr:rhomboid family intramembrane serine protease [Pseudomonadota bacterium]